MESPEKLLSKDIETIYKLIYSEIKDFDKLNTYDAVTIIGEKTEARKQDMIRLFNKAVSKLPNVYTYDNQKIQIRHLEINSLFEPIIFTFYRKNVEGPLYEWELESYE